MHTDEDTETPTEEERLAIEEARRTGGAFSTEQAKQLIANHRARLLVAHLAATGVKLDPRGAELLSELAAALEALPEEP